MLHDTNAQNLSKVERVVLNALPINSAKPHFLSVLGESEPNFERAYQACVELSKFRKRS